MLKHYVEFLYPGIYIASTNFTEIPERDVSKVEIPDNCFLFRFFDRIVSVIDGIPSPDRKNISNWYYKGEEMTLEQIKARFRNDDKYMIAIYCIEK